MTDTPGARARRRQRGNAVVELALVMPMLAFAATAVVDYGRALNTRTELASALRAGAHVAGGGPTAVARAAAAVAAAATVADIAVADPALACSCPQGNAVDCGDWAACPDRARKIQYMTLTASAPFAPMFQATYLGPRTVTSSVTVRLQ